MSYCWLLFRPPVWWQNVPRLRRLCRVSQCCPRTANSSTLPGAGVACPGSQLDVPLTQADRMGCPQLPVASPARSLPVKRRRKVQHLRYVE